MVWEELVTGNILPSSSVFNCTPFASNHLIVSVVKNWWKAFFRRLAPRGYFRIICSISKQACVTLHLPPPDTLTFERSLFVFSSIVTCNCGSIRAAVSAQKNPAAPPPITINFLFIMIKIKIRSFKHRTCFRTL